MTAELAEEVRNTNEKHAIQAFDTMDAIGDGSLTSVQSSDKNILLERLKQLTRVQYTANPDDLLLDDVTLSIPVILPKKLVLSLNNIVHIEQRRRKEPVHDVLDGIYVNERDVGIFMWTAPIGTCWEQESKVLDECVSVSSFRPILNVLIPEFVIWLTPSGNFPTL